MFAFRVRWYTDPCRSGEDVRIRCRSQRCVRLSEREICERQEEQAPNIEHQNTRQDRDVPEAGSVLVINKDPAISALLRGTVAISECGQDDVKRPNRQRKPRVSVLTGRINQDCLENLFSQVRCKGGQRFNPSAREFAFAYRSLTTSMLINPIPSANCIDDPDDILVSLSDLSKTSKNDARVLKRRNEEGGQGEIPAKQARQSETDPLVVDVIDDFQLSVTVVNVVVLRIETGDDSS